MTILRFTASADTTITDAYIENLSTRGTGSNMGASDVLEVFSIYAQASTTAGSDFEKSRILIKFPTQEIATARDTNKLPAKDSVKFFFKII